MRPSGPALLSMLCLCAASVPARAENASQPLDEPVLESPTLHCLGAYWIIQGDENKNAKIEVAYRKAGTPDWKPNLPLFRVEKGAHQVEVFTQGKDGKHVVAGRKENKVHVPEDAWLFAGSVLLLQPDTAYELQLRLSDPDGGAAERVLPSRTIAEPLAPPNAPPFHVVPGSGHGKGTASEPYQGLADAQSHAKPGDLFLLHAGTYEGTFQIVKSGAPGQPIVWRGAGDGECVLDARGQAAQSPSRGIDASGAHDVWFERLTVRHAGNTISASNSARVVVRRCHLQPEVFGINAASNDRDTSTGFFISDNLIEGPCVWPKTVKGIETPRGIQIVGTGHVVCYNRIHGFADAVDTYQESPRCCAIDFHNNDVSECTDDGFEMDYSERNTRCFFNRITNSLTGVSVQPVYGGPVYIFRNAMYNVTGTPFKMHNSPSGALMFQNTCVRSGMAMPILSNEKVRNCVFRNNLFIGAGGNYALEAIPPMIDCDFDYDGFGGGPWRDFIKWSNVRYLTLEEFKAKAPVYKHLTLVDPANTFAAGTRAPDDEKKQYPVSVNDLRLKEGCAALDAGEALPGLNDGFAGRAPDLGAYELGAPLPHYGPRPE